MATEREVDLCVVGGGPAGLALAFARRRARPDTRIVVLEAAATPGGWVRTERVPAADGGGAWQLELGPQAVRPSAELDAVTAALGLTDEIVDAPADAAVRWLGRGGRVHELPAGPRDLLSTTLLTLPQKLRLLAEPWIRSRTSRGETVTAFATRRFGRAAGPLVRAMVSGVFAGDADALEATAAFPILGELERAHGSILRGAGKRARAARERGEPKRAALQAPRAGMRRFVEALESALGDAIATGSPVDRLEYAAGRAAPWCVVGSDPAAITYRARELVLATPAHVTARLLAPIDDRLGAHLAAVPFASVANVHLGFREADRTDTMRGFGFLLDRAEHTAALGAMWVSEFLPERAPPGHGLARVMLGGSLHPEVVDREDLALVDLAEATLRQYVGFRGEFVFRHVHRAVDAIPQYVGDHSGRLVRIRERLADWPGLTLAGNSYDAVALTPQLAVAGTDA